MHLDYLAVLNTKAPSPLGERITEGEAKQTPEWGVGMVGKTMIFLRPSKTFVNDYEVICHVCTRLSQITITENARPYNERGKIAFRINKFREAYVRLDFHNPTPNPS